MQLSGILHLSQMSAYEDLESDVTAVGKVESASDLKGLLGSPRQDLAQIHSGVHTHV